VEHELEDSNALYLIDSAAVWPFARESKEDNVRADHASGGNEESSRGYRHG